ncbi:hypothetical protein CRG98_033413 [Punica granatum]|uniref:Uncharacterized protein n=1 Tax=Punica granatum TaxID=22663 RepID=A0A2I0IQ85_PUNGR|nr:hypothetical protein CRG98_033413 [Punica granatum]
MVEPAANPLYGRVHVRGANNIGLYHAYDYLLPWNGRRRNQTLLRVVTNPNKFIRASTIIGHLTDDIVTQKIRDHILTMHRGNVFSKLMRRKNRGRRSTMRWKDINERCLHPHPVHEPLLIRVFNLTRAIDAVYIDNKDRYTHPNLELKQFVTSLLIDPVPS